MSSAFTPNIPAATDRPSASQSQIQSNFNAIQDDLNKNHVEISDLSNRGKHKFLQMPSQGSAPATSATEAALYMKTVVNQVHLFYRRRGSGNEVQLTAGNPNVPTLGNDGVTFIPGGLLLQWGQATINGSGTNGGITTISFSVNFSGTRPYSVTVTPFRTINNSDTVYLVPGSFGVSSFDVRNTSSGGASGINTICWMAIGPA